MVHSLLPLFPAYFPASHEVQLSARLLEYLPASHDVLVGRGGGRSCWHPYNASEAEGGRSHTHQFTESAAE